MNTQGKMTDFTPPPPIGDNRPPRDLREQLAEDRAQTRHDVETLAARANVAPKKITTPADLDAVGALVKDARALWKRTDGARTIAKAPYLQAGNDVQSFFAVFLDRLKRIGDTFQAIGDDYQREVDRAARAKAQAAADAARAEEQRQRDLAAFTTPAEEVAANTAAEAASEAAYAADLAGKAKAADLVRTRTESGVLASARTTWKGTITDWDALNISDLKPYIKREAIQSALDQAIKMGIRKINGTSIEQITRAMFK